MEKPYSYILIVTGIVLVTPIFFIIGLNLSPSSGNLEECQTLEYTGEDSINIVFLSTEEQAIKYEEGLFNIEPFKSNKDKFNLHVINTGPEQGDCELYKDKAVLCSSKKAIKRTSSCPNDYVIAITDEYERSTRSSTFRGVISLNAKHPPQTFAHEFGHAFANLADEYVPANLLSESPNCLMSCEDFSGEIDGCFQGCSDTSHYRSIENGLMKTLSSNNFGKFNEREILKKIQQDLNSQITGLAINDNPLTECKEERYYLLELNENEEIIGATIEEGCPITRLSGEFTYSLTKSEQEIVKGTFSDIIITEAEEEGHLTGGPEKYEGNSFLQIPKTDAGGEKITISSKTGIISELNLEEVDSLPCQV